jgi:trehalose 6-phosphate synthase
MRSFYAGRTHRASRVTPAGPTSAPLRAQQVGSRSAPFVLVTDRLPALAADETAVGISGQVDDPVTAALADLTAQLRGRWVGRSQGPTPQSWGVPLHSLTLETSDLEAYEDQSESCIWPLYHDLMTPAFHEAHSRRGYLRANVAFAAAVARHAAPGGSVWVHDFQLQLVPAIIRGARPDLRIGFYMQSAFPAPDQVRRMPMWREILVGLLSADHVGFQNPSSAQNFLHLIGHEIDDVPTVGVYPTSVDTAALVDLSQRAATDEASAKLRRELGSPTTVILSIGPVDQTQGIEQRLLVFETLFRQGRLVAGETVIVQILTGNSGRSSEQYARTAQLVARINGQFGSVGRAPVHSVVDEPTLAERAALYRAADLMVATPLREAATLPALEFITAARPHAALILSEFSGTAEILPEAYIVNPHDGEATADAVIAALDASEDWREKRLQAMRSYPLSYDSHTWAANFLVSMQTNIGRPPGQLTKRSHPDWPSQSPRYQKPDNDWLMSDPP